MNENSILLFWCSGKSLPIMLQLIKYWGYVYVNVLVAWVKTNKDGNPKKGLGFWTRGALEMVIMAKKGKTSHFRHVNRNIP